MQSRACFRACTQAGTQDSETRSRCSGRGGEEAAEYGAKIGKRRPRTQTNATWKMTGGSFMRNSFLSVGGPSAPRGTGLAGSPFLAFTFDFQSRSSPSEGGRTCGAGRRIGDTEPVSGCFGGLPGSCTWTFSENTTRGREPSGGGFLSLCGDLGGGSPASGGNGPPTLSTCALVPGV